MSQTRRVRVVLIMLLLVGLIAPLRPVHRTVRAFGRYLPTPQSDTALTNENFKLIYDEGELTEAAAMLQLLDEALADLRQWLPDRTPKPIVVRLHQSQESLQRALGPGEYGPTVGAYYLGRLELLAPRAWYEGLSLEDALAHYSWQGPLVHELTHLFLDYQSRSAYPLWFTEGLAQYWEMRLRGYVWQEAGSAWRSSPHNLAELERNFAMLPESIAYQESHSLVHFLYQRIGNAGMNDLLTRLEQGHSFEAALQMSYGDMLAAIENDWKAWLLD